MGLMVGTIIKWFNPEDTDIRDEGGECCVSGQCIAIITKVTDKDGNDLSDIPSEWRDPYFMLKYWEVCDLHKQIDPDGCGPYDSRYLWQIGQYY